MRYPEKVGCWPNRMAAVKHPEKLERWPDRIPDMRYPGGMRGSRPGGMRDSRPGGMRNFRQGEMSDATCRKGSDPQWVVVQAVEGSSGQLHDHLVGSKI